jgi:hypothetical protein
MGRISKIAGAAAASVAAAAIAVGLAAMAAGAETNVVDEVLNPPTPMASLPKMPPPVLLNLDTSAARLEAPSVVVRPEVVLPEPAPPVVAPVAPTSGVTFSPTVAGTTFTRPAPPARPKAAVSRHRGTTHRAATSAATRRARAASVLAFVAPERALVKKVRVTSPPVDPRPVQAHLGLVRLLAGSLW